MYGSDFGHGNFYILQYFGKNVLQLCISSCMGPSATQDMLAQL